MKIFSPDEHQKKAEWKIAKINQQREQLADILKLTTDLGLDGYWMGSGSRGIFHIFQNSLRFYIGLIDYCDWEELFKIEDFDKFGLEFREVCSIFIEKFFKDVEDEECNSPH